MENNIELKFYQADFIPGFAAYVKPQDKENKPFIVLNVGSLLGLVGNKDIEKSELPYVVAECLMHEVFHALEDWANVEFSEDKVDKLIEKYRDCADKNN